ncbi:CAP domain-containing protein [Haloglomus halophilum]|uniref:CAP domain-containing protein n=1 Tax=Haloglomus halophilum TaxID=2962672 RepID=UPI0020C9E633|nr:CAP domain-containing protein [Haloglomus halophilum]
MANKIALLLLGGIVVTATSAGAAIGVYLGDGGPLLGGNNDGGDGSAAPTATLTATATATTAPATDADAGGGNGDSDGGGGGTATEEPGSAGTTPPPTSTATPPTATPEPDATATPGPVRPDSFNETKVRLLVVEEINDRRVERGLERLRSDEVLTRMAGNHSRRMSGQGYVSHAAGGYTTAERYRRNGLDQRCGILDSERNTVREDREIEALDKVSAGGEFDNRTNRNEREIAVDAVENWFATDSERRKLTYENAGQLGVGVHVSGSNRAYLTVDLCS